MFTGTVPTHNTEGVAKLRLATLDSLDGRTKAARLARALVDNIESDLGGADCLSAGERQLAQRAGVLAAMLESQEAAWLAGDKFNLTDYLASINAQRRVLESLGLQRRSRDVTPDLQTYLASRTSEASAA